MYLLRYIYLIHILYVVICLSYVAISLSSSMKKGNTSEKQKKALTYCMIMKCQLCKCTNTVYPED